MYPYEGQPVYIVVYTVWGNYVMLVHNLLMEV